MPDQHRDLLYLLHDTARLLRVEADKRARATGMTRAQWVLLLRVRDRPGLSQKELSELLEVEPITVARLVDRLEGRGMVERRADPRDRRIWRLHLRPEADPVLQEIEIQRLALRELLSAGLDPAALLATTEGLLRMKANILAADREEMGRDDEKEVA
jgi:DNA-binding MarR family transcriptional regulator